MTKATRPDTQHRIAYEILSKLQKQTEDNFIVFAQLRAEWEKRCEGNFDLFLLQEIFENKAWLQDSCQGQQRHGRGFRGEAEKQIVKLWIFI